jgi:outer membrane protein OmpA-like peptidoglycan-associated protein
MTRLGFSKLCAGSLIGALLAGCTTNPFTGERQVSKTATGAVIGAAAGATVGVLTGDDSRERRRRALLGAGVGALAGGAVGAYMDAQEAKLRKQLQGTGVSVTRDGQNLILNMPGNVTFATDSAGLNASFFSVLQSVSLVLKEYSRTIIDVAGHTDSTGALDYNQSLSERRANAVAQYLRTQGISDLRILARGYGPNRPIAPNGTPEGRQQNRRVELLLVPLVEG